MLPYRPFISPLPYLQCLFTRLFNDIVYQLLKLCNLEQEINNSTDQNTPSEHGSRPGGRQMPVFYGT